MAHHVLVTCDAPGCGSEERAEENVGPPGGWLVLFVKHLDQTSDGDEFDAEVLHVCSWTCMAAISQANVPPDDPSALGGYNAHHVIEDESGRYGMLGEAGEIDKGQG